jgi:hypothetical protein
VRGLSSHGNQTPHPARTRYALSRHPLPQGEREERKIHGRTRSHQGRHERRAHLDRAGRSHGRAFRSADAIKAALEAGWVTVGTEVDIRHLAATPVGATVRTTAKVIAVERRIIRFEVEAFDEKRRIGEGRHARGLVNVESFTKQFGPQTRTSS